jgi:pimeloyl-ACP methyl ester carboxylesterase
MNANRRELNEKWIIVDGLPLFFRYSDQAASTGATPIVHLHGFGISGRYLVPAAELLAADYPTYVPDLPGYGRSHKPKRTLSIPELAHAVAAFLDEVGIERAVLLGNSMGCMVTVEFANAYPDRIERAILVSPAGGPHNQPIYRGLPQLGRDGLLETPRILPIAVPDYVRFGPFSSLRLFHAMTQYPTISRVLALNLPILVVAGARDPLVSTERLRELVEQHPDVTLVIHDKAAHAINFSHPRTLACVVRSWLADQPIVVEGAEPGEVVVLGQRDSSAGDDVPLPPVASVPESVIEQPYR